MRNAVSEWESYWKKEYWAHAQKSQTMSLLLLNTFQEFQLLVYFCAMCFEPFEWHVELFIYKWYEYDSDYSHIYGRLPLPTRGFRQYPPPNRQIYVSEWEWKLFCSSILEIFVEVIQSFVWLNIIHIIHYLIVNSASYDKFYFTNALWYYNPNWIKYEWLDDARKYYLTKICFGTKNYSKKKYSCTQILMCAYWWKLPMYVNIN